jgi:hypothetical protein
VHNMGQGAGDFHQSSAFYANQLNKEISILN